ncbi:MAG: glycosyltransferase [Patescibacteria group bacterium]
MKILIVFPVYNEQLIVEKSVRQTLDFCRGNFCSDRFKIVVADNNSTDKTAEVVKGLVGETAELEYFFIPEKGKGLAWRSVFLQETADIYIFMDVDLAVALEDLKSLVAGIKSGYALVIGSRFLAAAKVERSFLRSLVSFTYRFLVRLMLKSKISDFPCGFKALNQTIKEKVLPLTQDKLFFLDTELVVLAEKMGYRIKEVPVNWSQFRDLARKSTVNIMETAVEYFVKIWRLRKRINNLSERR